ncbi:alpha/beta hydrolase [Roseateles sp. MS654]|uniref:alpha/beta hydrolase n=1 Tax=Roseateles sp. MS654 TaxID=3412685 RepID=UPI003C2E7594
MTRNEFLLDGSGQNARTGVMLIHGLSGAPNEMRILARGLNAAGYTVYAVELAGHCGSMDDLLMSRWSQWLDSARQGADRLAGLVDRVVVGGLSMGAVLALALATERPRQISAVLALSTTFKHDGWSMPAYTRLSFLLPLLRVLGIGRRRQFMELPPFGIKDDALRDRVVGQMNAGDSTAAGLPGNPWWSIAELQKLSAYVQRRLGLIRSPCLVVHARDDDIASTRNALTITRGVTKAPVELLLLNDSYHMITIDRERRKVIARCVAFLEGLGAARPTGPATALARAPQAPADRQVASAGEGL